MFKTVIDIMNCESVQFVGNKRDRLEFLELCNNERRIHWGNPNMEMPGDYVSGHPFIKIGVDSDYRLTHSENISEDCRLITITEVKRLLKMSR